jgi:hypothetical protein
LIERANVRRQEQRVLRFGTEAWFVQARALVEPVKLSADLSCALQFDVSGKRWFFRVASGRVAGWDIGSLDEPDVELRWQTEDARRILGRELRSDDAMQATTVVARTADDIYVGPPAPLNLACRPELASLPVVAGATVTVQYRYRRGPFGDVDHVLRFEDGRLAEERLGRLEDPDVRVDVTYSAMAQVRAGDISIVDGLADGAVHGDIGPLAALAGILESPEFHTAEVATGRHALALAVLGELDADPAFATATQQLAASTRWT